MAWMTRMGTVEVGEQGKRSGTDRSMETEREVGAVHRRWRVSNSSTTHRGGRTECGGSLRMLAQTHPPTSAQRVAIAGLPLPSTATGMSFESTAHRLPCTWSIRDARLEYSQENGPPSLACTWSVRSSHRPRGKKASVGEFLHSTAWMDGLYGSTNPSTERGCSQRAHLEQRPGSLQSHARYGSCKSSHACTGNRICT